MEAAKLVRLIALEKAKISVLKKVSAETIGLNIAEVLAVGEMIDTATARINVFQTSLKALNG